jgi:DNA-binding transcriptional regulator GbsR (MarR family)/predicted RNA-binding Zn-ribbon protein involved in translation (DUF1610 family)
MLHLSEALLYLSHNSFIYITHKILQIQREDMNMTLDMKTLGNSELFYQILRELLQGEKTPTELSDQMETSSQSINNYLKKMRELDIIEKAPKQGRSQPYQVNEEGILPFLLDYWRNYVEREILGDESAEEVLKSEIQMYNTFSPYDIEEALERDLPTLLFEFMDHYFKWNGSGTLNDMIEKFLDGIEMVDLHKDNRDYPGWLYGLRALAKKRHDYVKDPQSMMEQAIRQYQLKVDTIEKVHKFLMDVEGEDYLKDVETESVRECPNCEHELGKDYHVDIDGENTCPECGEEFQEVNNRVYYQCPECGERLTNLEHGEKSECGCGKLLNQSELRKERESKNAENTSED